MVSAMRMTIHLGYSVWTKLIRNHTAIQYLFNAEAFDFNHQFENRLSKPIKVYPVTIDIVAISRLRSIFRVMHSLRAVYTIQKIRERLHW